MSNNNKQNTIEISDADALRLFERKAQKGKIHTGDFTSEFILDILRIKPEHISRILRPTAEMQELVINLDKSQIFNINGPILVNLKIRSSE